MIKKIILSFLLICLCLSANSYASSYTPVTPCRILDTRINAIPPASLPTPLQAGVTYGYNYLNFGCVPTLNGDPHAVAIAANVTVVNPTGGGYLVLWPDLLAMPDTSNIDFVTGQVISNFAIIGVASNDYFDIHYVHSPGATLDLVIDVVGYFQ